MRRCHCRQGGGCIDDAKNIVAREPNWNPDEDDEVHEYPLQEQSQQAITVSEVVQATSIHINSHTHTTHTHTERTQNVRTQGSNRMGRDDNATAVWAAVATYANMDKAAQLRERSQRILGPARTASNAVPTNSLMIFSTAQKPSHGPEATGSTGVAAGCTAIISRFCFFDALIGRPRWSTCCRGRPRWSTAERAFCSVLKSTEPRLAFATILKEWSLCSAHVPPWASCPLSRCCRRKS